MIKYGKVAFLNGELDFHDDYHKKFFKKLNTEGVDVRLIDNLFNKPGRMTELADYDTIVVGSTGFEHERLRTLFTMLKNLPKIPENVIFAPNEDPFVMMAHEMSGKMKFWGIGYFDLEPYELDYLNK